MNPIPDERDPKKRRWLVSCFRLAAKLQDRFPEREVIETPYAADDEFFWFSKGGKVRRCKTRDGSIWVTDQVAGPPWMKKIRTVSWLKNLGKPCGPT